MALNIILNIVWVFSVHFSRNFKSISNGRQVIAGVRKSYSHLKLHVKKIYNEVVSYCLALQVYRTCEFHNPVNNRCDEIRIEEVLNKYGEENLIRKSLAAE